MKLKIRQKCCCLLQKYFKVITYNAASYLHSAILVFPLQSRDLNKPAVSVGYSYVLFYTY